ncbi:hypothetical protein XH99_29060 [Bradyrhizobium nanningense]|uniref:Uncharacterized protein n=1 Tax=Bradyrhizobium nanningense TaxID=1325118 RepID=A0A4Q0RYE5_9BRAD|nr:hypothetical protein XH99_29060 [Bradyrhizobium nanningense]RXH29306.1 hypothetical protein XH84_22730 [Bradyrhizobium nanningense]
MNLRGATVVWLLAGGAGRRETSNVLWPKKHGARRRRAPPQMHLWALPMRSEGAPMFDRDVQADISSSDAVYSKFVQ